LPLAIMEDAEYEELHVELRDGDRLLLFSDGALEISNAADEMLGLDGLIGMLKRQGYPAADLQMEVLEEDLLKYSNCIRLADDLTLIEIRIQGAVRGCLHHKSGSTAVSRWSPVPSRPMPKAAEQVQDRSAAPLRCNDLFVVFDAGGCRRGRRTTRWPDAAWPRRISAPIRYTSLSNCAAKRWRLSRISSIMGLSIIVDLHEFLWCANELRTKKSAIPRGYSRPIRQATHRRDSGPILRKRGRKFATGPWSTTPRMSVLVKAATENTEGTEQQVILALNAGDLCLLKKRFAQADLADSLALQTALDKISPGTFFVAPPALLEG
jgi:hypothetical protein